MADHNPQDPVDEALELLASDRRRRVLRYLLEAENKPVDRRQLAERIATDEERDPTDIEVALIHRDLPKLADRGVIEYDHRSGGLRLAETAEALEPLLDVSDECGDTQNLAPSR